MDLRMFAGRRLIGEKWAFTPVWNAIRTGLAYGFSKMTVKSASEIFWWGKYLLHGGNRINDFFACHASLEVVASSETDLGSCRSRDVLLRRIA